MLIGKTSIQKVTNLDNCVFSKNSKLKIFEIGRNIERININKIEIEGLIMHEEKQFVGVVFAIIFGLAAALGLGIYYGGKINEAESKLTIQDRITNLEIDYGAISSYKDIKPFTTPEVKQTYKNLVNKFETDLNKLKNQVNTFDNTSEDVIKKTKELDYKLAILQKSLDKKGLINETLKKFKREG